MSFDIAIAIERPRGASGQQRRKARQIGDRNQYVTATNGISARGQRNVRFTADRRDV